MSYVQSSNIEIFPVAKIRNSQGNRLFYEHNVANMVRQVIDTNGFVISGPTTKDFNSNTKELTFNYLNFNIYGYNILIKSITLPSIQNNGEEEIYAQLKLTTSDYAEINGQDEDNNYTGLVIEVKSKTENVPLINIVDGKPNWVRLKLLTSQLNSNGEVEWVVPDESYERFDISKLITKIDGKV